MAFDENGQPVYGVLATDRPHQLKAHVLFDFAFGTSVGASWFGASGIPRTREAAFIPGNAFPVMYLGRNSDGRLPFFSQLDLYAQHLLRFGSKVRLTGQGEPGEYRRTTADLPSTRDGASETVMGSTCSKRSPRRTRFAARPGRPGEVSRTLPHQPPNPPSASAVGAAPRSQAGPTNSPR